jgi:hypothetical protein
MTLNFFERAKMHWMKPWTGACSSTAKFPRRLANCSKLRPFVWRRGFWADGDDWSCAHSFPHVLFHLLLGPLARAGLSEGGFHFCLVVFFLVG